LPRRGPHRVLLPGAELNAPSREPAIERSGFGTDMGIGEIRLHDGPAGGAKPLTQAVAPREALEGARERCRVADRHEERVALGDRDLAATRYVRGDDRPGAGG